MGGAVGSSSADVIKFCRNLIDSWSMSGERGSSSSTSPPSSPIPGGSSISSSADILFGLHPRRGGRVLVLALDVASVNEKVEFGLVVLEVTPRVPSEPLWLGIQAVDCSDSELLPTAARTGESTYEMFLLSSILVVKLVDCSFSSVFPVFSLHTVSKFLLQLQLLDKVSTCQNPVRWNHEMTHQFKMKCKTRPDEKSRRC